MNGETKHIPRSLILACTLSLAVRIVAIFYLHTYLDDYSHADIGIIPYNLLHGHGYTYAGTPSGYFLPVYTFLWAAMMIIFGISGGQLALQLIQAAALSGLPILWYRFSLSFFDNRIVAYLSSMWLAFYPELLLLSSTMYADSIQLFLWMLVLVQIVHWRDSQRYSSGIILGVIMTALVLTKGRMFAFAAVTIMYFFLVDWKQRSAAVFRRYLIPVVCTTILMSVWVVRNWIQLDAFFVTETYRGQALWVGHNAAANGTGRYRPGFGMLVPDSSKLSALELTHLGFPASPELKSELRDARTEAEMDRAYRREAVSFMINHPGKELELSMRKIFYAWWRVPTSELTKHPLYIAPWCLTLLLFFVGLIKTFTSARKYYLFYLIFIVSTAVQVVFFVGVRFRLPVYPFVFGLASLGFVHVMEIAVSRNPVWQKKYCDFTSSLLH